MSRLHSLVPHQINYDDDIDGDIVDMVVMKWYYADVDDDDVILLLCLAGCLDSA